RLFATPPCHDRPGAEAGHANGIEPRPARGMTDPGNAGPGYPRGTICPP
ncbi:MAG: TerD family protein, partial [Proteobacteria bacterium]|nr:TerD family protein [Pseudomonadota bacterium]